MPSTRSDPAMDIDMKDAQSESISSSIVPGAPDRVCTLRDGARILLRRVLPSDRDELAAGYALLEPSSRRSRFGVAPDQLSPSQLDALVDLDFDDRFALAAIALDEPGHPGVGVARYARSHEAATEAEAAVVVLDAYQRRGIGRILLLELVDVARAHGISTLTATVMWDATELLDTLRSLGATLEPDEPGVADVRIDLSGEKLLARGSPCL